jgi:hypothetical protein
VGRCEHGTPHPVVCGCFVARQRRTALTWRRAAFLGEPPARKSLTQDSGGAQAGALDDPLGGSDGDWHCTSRREGVIQAAGAITWVGALRNATKRRVDAVPVPWRAYVTSGGPLVTTRAGPRRLAQRAGQRVCAARSCSTRWAAGRASHTGYRGRSRGRTPTGSVPVPDLRLHHTLPRAVAPGPNDAAAMHNPPQCDFRLNLRPGRARLLSEAGRHSAPIARQRATREERHAGLAWPTYCNKPKRAPSVMDSMVRTVAPDDGRCPPEKEWLHLRFFEYPAIGGTRAPA